MILLVGRLFSFSRGIHFAARKRTGPAAARAISQGDKGNCSAFKIIYADLSVARTAASRQVEEIAAGINFTRKRKMRSRQTEASRTGALNPKMLESAKINAEK